MLNYEEFKKEIVAEMKKRLGNDAEICVRFTTKINCIEEQISFQFPGSPVSPSIGLEELYHRDYMYMFNGDVGLLADNLVNLINEKPDFQMPIFTIEEAKKNVFPMLVSKERNIALLKECPYKEVPNTDLVMIPCWRTGETSGTIVKNTRAEQLGLSVDELFKIANDNLSNEPHIFEDLMITINKMLGLGKVNSGIAKMYLVSSCSMRYGAIMLFKEGVIEEILQKLGHPFYVLPSSIHEVLVIADTSGRKRGAQLYKNTVKIVNKQEVAEADILSGHIYYCDISGKISMLL